MYYGLDMSDVRYETDHAGNKLKATVPWPMFSALIEFWREARRAQTASLEASTRPGQYKGSLTSVAVPEPSTDIAPPIPPQVPPPPPTRAATKQARLDSHWQEMLQQIPHQGAVPASPVTPEPESPEPLRKYRAVCFFREFEAPIPEEIAARIREGVYFLRAWREYRELTRRDVAELMGKTHDNVSRHENAYCIPGEKTLRAFADIFDCSLAQLTPKEGSSTAPWLEVVDDRGERGERGNPAFPPASPQPSTEELGPGSSEYPKAVVAHIIGGKSPITAWRVYRDLSIADLANAYGCTPDNIKQLEAREGGLRRGTREKLAAVFHCPADQLQRPDDIQVAETPLRVSKRTAQPEEVLRRARRAEARSA